MASLFILAVVIIVALVLAAILFPLIKKWTLQRKLGQDGSMPLYQCSLARKGSQSGSDGSDDVYYCVEVARVPEEETSRK
jgi:hypothetical protein